jgi:pimeloyl-ACP methyl ester carboxylesterase
MARASFEEIEAPVKGFYVFADSAHCPHFEQPQLAAEILLRAVARAMNRQADAT